jgi:hypothetical protein
MNTIASILHEKKASSKQIQVACQVSQATACSWLRGASTPSRKHVRTMARRFSVRTERLLHARENSKLAPKPEPKFRHKKTIIRQNAKPKDVPNNPARFDEVLRVAKLYAALTQDERVVVGVVADGLSLLDQTGGES